MNRDNEVNTMTTMAERLNEGLRIRNLKSVDLVKMTGIGKSSISSYLSGKYEPKQKNIYKIAKALDVSEAWLMGLDVPMSQALDEAIEKANQLKEILSEIHRLIDSLFSFKDSLSAEAAKAATREAITECLDSLLTKDEGN